MSVALTNLRRRMVTVLVAEGSDVRAVRIAAGATARDLPDSVLAVDSVDKAIRQGEFLVKRERSSRGLMRG